MIIYPEITRESFARDGLQQGFFRVEEEFYHADIPALSQSLLKEYGRSPAHYKVAFEASNEGSDNPVFAEGKAWHLAILEPDRFESGVAFEPSADRRTKAGKEAYAEWLGANHGKIILPEETYTRIKDGVAQIRSDENLLPYIQCGHAELAVFGKSPVDNLWRKGKIDYWKPDTRFILDVKTTSSLEDFAYSIIKYKYLMQAAYYTDLVEMITEKPVSGFGFLAIEKKKPYAFKIFLPTDRAIAKGREIYQTYLNKHLQCLQDNHWPMYESLVEIWEPSEWYLGRGV